MTAMVAPGSEEIGLKHSVDQSAAKVGDPAIVFSTSGPASGAPCSQLTASAGRRSRL